MIRIETAPDTDWREPVQSHGTTILSAAELIPVGRVLGAYGVRGWVRVDPFNPEQSIVEKVANIWIGGTRFGVGQVKRHRGQLLLALVDQHKQAVASREQALALKGSEVSVPRSDFPEPDSDEFYWVDLIGCRVLNQLGEDLGPVARVVDHGADPVMHIERADGKAGGPRLIPFVADIVTDVSLVNQTIRVNWDSSWD